MKAAFWHSNSSSLLPIPKIIPLPGVLMQSLSECRGLILSENSGVWEINVNSLSINKVFLDISVEFIVCTETLSMLIGEGSVYIYGNDHLKTGVLGIADFQSEVPVKIPVDAYITTGSLYTHAAIIDTEGKLYIWGAADYPSIKPQYIDNKNSFRCKEVTCGENFTAVLTDGCYVHLYGSIGNPLTTDKKKSFSHPELEKMTVIEISAGKNFLCVLIENGEVFAYDCCMDLVKLPLPESILIRKVACCKDMAYGLSDCEIIEWSQGPRQSNNSCILTTWTGRYYTLEKPYSQNTQIFSSFANTFSIVFTAGKTIGAMPLGVKAQVVQPYKWSLYGNKRNISESMSAELKRMNSFEDLSRLYSIGNNENTISKLIKYRKEHELMKVIHKNIKPIVKEILGSCFRDIREWAFIKKNYEVPLTAALMQTPLEKVLQKSEISKVLKGFRAIQSFAEKKNAVDAMELENKLKSAHIREEALRNLFHTVKEAAFKYIFYGFCMIKELEMRKLQKKTAVLSFGQVINRNLWEITKRIFSKLKQHYLQSAKLKFFSYKLLKNKFLQCVSQIQLCYTLKSRISQSFSLVLIKTLEKYESKKAKSVLKTWKIQVDVSKTEQIKAKFHKQMAIKSIILIMSYVSTRSLKNIFELLKSKKNFKKIRENLEILQKTLKKVLITSKHSHFLSIISLYKSDKSFEILFKTLKKTRKKVFRWTFKQIDLFISAVHHNSMVKGFWILQNSTHNLFIKQLHMAWSTLKSIALSISNPDYSFFSPKIQNLRLKNLSSLNMPYSPGLNSTTFEFSQTFQRLKKPTSTSQSVSVLNTPKSTIFSSMNQEEKELQSLKTTLIQKKVQEALQKNKEKSGNNAKPPLRPPWKPASASLNVAAKKLPINSMIRREQYALQLKERVKSHSKTLSTDVSHLAGTPFATSRNSSRIKSQKIELGVTKNLLANTKFAIILLENVIKSVVNRRNFEGFWKIKCRQKPVQKKMPSWQGNLYKIGFEKIKTTVRCAAIREILDCIKSNKQRIRNFTYFA